MLISLTCPSCNAQMEADSSRQVFSCPFCNHKMLLNNKVRHEHQVRMSGRVDIDGIARIENLLRRAEIFYEQYDFDRALEYCNRVLDLDCSNEGALKLYDRILFIPPEKNFVLKNHAMSKVFFHFDRTEAIALSENMTLEKKFDLGLHEIYCYTKTVFQGKIKSLGEYRMTIDDIAGIYRFKVTQDLNLNKIFLTGEIERHRRPGYESWPDLYMHSRGGPSIQITDLITSRNRRRRDF